MKKLYYLFLIGIFFTGACTSAQKSTPSGNPSLATPAVSAEKQSQPAEKSVVSQPAAKTTSSKVAASASQTEPAPETPVQGPENTEKTDPITDVIAQARRQQTLSNPVPDSPAFKNEEIIPLKNRNLSPFAYEPVVQTPTEAPWSGEELKYGVYYSFVKAGTAYIKNRGLTTVNGRAAYLIQTTAFSASVIDKVFKVRDINYSWIDATHFYSLGYTQSLREGNYVRDEWITFDYPNNRYYGELKKKKDTREISGELTQQVLDILSALYYVRTHDLEVGKDIVFDIINREEKYPLLVKVLKTEQIKTAAGKFDCVVVEPQFRGEGIFVSKGKSLKVWLTNDAYKMPVKMQTEVFIGSVSAELLEYKRN